MATYREFDPEIDQLLLNLSPTQVGRVRCERAGEGERPAVWKAIEAAERVFACIALLAILPCLALAGFIIVLLSGRCPLVAHRRVGKGGRAISVLKLRTMWGGRAAGSRRGRFIEELEGEPVPEVKSPRDPRVGHAFAAACRRYSIDELPQLWHVVRGDLCLVGPRPLTAAELADYYGPDAEEVLRVTPGLTGLWQVRGRDSLSYRRRRRLDLFLVRHWSLPLYFTILFSTIPKVITGKDAW